MDSDVRESRRTEKGGQNRAIYSGSTSTRIISNRLKAHMVFFKTVVSNSFRSTHATGTAHAILRLLQTRTTSHV